MCTLIAMWRMFDEAPLVLAANRDERLDRPADPPAIMVHAGRQFIAPSDRAAGGTWLGFNDAEAFVGITNRHLAVKPNASRSRGLLVLDALAAGTAEEIDASLSALDVSPYSGFHLFVADRTEAFIFWSDGAVLNRIVLTPGITIVTERSFGAAPTSREQLIRERVGAPAVPPDDRALIGILSTRAEISFEGINVSVPEIGYGTRSSTILRLGPRPREVRMLHADGPPDRTPFSDLKRLLELLP
jgi:uncharacterized protein with NRDE domain